MSSSEMKKQTEEKKICIIYTGGTIGMTLTESCYAPAPGYFQDAISKMDDLHADGMPKYDVVEFSPLLDSSNITYVEWNKIAEEIRDRYEDYDGFVVLHGTDSMAYTASALSFMLGNLSKPVILTGSQIPLCEIRSDAKDNLTTSLLIAASDEVSEVALYFGHKLMRGNRAMKESADGLIAFTSPNYPPLADAGIEIKYNTHRLLTRPSGKLRVQTIKPSKIGVIKLFPGIQFKLFEPIIEEGLDALVLETFGTGNIPGYDEMIIPLLSRAIEKGTIVVIITQCPQGTVRLGAYETSKELEKAGVLSGFNMTTEATVAKLYYLLSLGLFKGEVSKLFALNLRGEMDN